MSDIRVASRYAKSLFELAQERGILEKVVEDVQSFLKVCSQNHDFCNMLRSPLVMADKKKAVIHRIFGETLQPITLTFVDIVRRKKREEILPVIFEQFMVMYNEGRGIISATVFTAVPVSERILQDISSQLEKKTSRKVELKTALRPELIGGYVLQYEDKLLDASVSAQLRNLRTHLINNN